MPSVMWFNSHWCGCITAWWAGSDADTTEERTGGGGKRPQLPPTEAGGEEAGRTAVPTHVRDSPTHSALWILALEYFFKSKNFEYTG